MKHGVTKHHHENFSLIGGVYLFKSKVTYVAPQISIRYFRPLEIKGKGGQVGIFISTHYWRTNIMNSSENIFTQELGFSIYGLNVSYGYNIFLNKEPLTFSKHRIALRFMAF